jgi:hypothetical protein
MQSEVPAHPARGFILASLIASELLTPAQAEEMTDGILAALEEADFRIEPKRRFKPWEEGFPFPMEPGV